MRMPMRLRQVPTRLATGAYILYSGLAKRSGAEELATTYHGMAAGAYPFVKSIPPRRFLRLLSVAEITTGAVLLAPFVPATLAGAALTAFSGGLVTLYLRTPSLRQPGSLAPNEAGVAVSKDVWMLGVGLGLLADAATDRPEH